MKAQSLFLSAALAALVAFPASAQQSPGAAALGDTGTSAPAAEEDSVVESEAAISLLRPIHVQYYRPQDQRGLTMFETPKEAGAPFTGFQLDWGAAFTQQFQALEHSNAALPRLVDGVDQNRLAELGMGFNLATANLYLNAQVAPGIRVALESYMSSRHHNEFWVKGGYLQIDESPIDHALLNRVMEFTSLRVGHFELNYGDAHFRRSDNGNAMHNPFVENYIADAFATEIGAEATFQTGPFLAVAGVTNGTLKGGVTNGSVERRPAFYGKLGVDRQLSEDLRVRLSGSAYRSSESPQSTLYAGDRAGSRYYNVLDNAAGADFRNGRLNPGFNNEVTAYQVNPFVKLGGLELFGVLEWAEGRKASEASTRSLSQYAVDAIYRFGADERFYAGGRYNTASAELAPALEVSSDRAALGGGWFVTPNVLMKAEYVTQDFNHFAPTDIRHGASFSGLVFEGVVAF